MHRRRPRRSVCSMASVAASDHAGRVVERRKVARRLARPCRQAAFGLSYVDRACRSSQHERWERTRSVTYGRGSSPMSRAPEVATPGKIAADFCRCSSRYREVRELPPRSGWSSKAWDVVSPPSKAIPGGRAMDFLGRVRQPSNGHQSSVMLALRQAVELPTS